MATGGFQWKLTTILMVLFVGVALSQTGGTSMTTLCNYAKWKDLCTSMVRGATDWQDGVENSLQSTIEASNAIEGKMIPILETAFAKLPKNSLDSGVEACREDFKRITRDLNSALAALAKNDNSTVDYLLRAGLYPIDCNTAFSEFQVVPPAELNHLNDQFNQHIHTCIAVFRQVPPESLQGQHLPARPPPKLF